MLVRLLAAAVLVLTGLLSCDSQLVLPGEPTDPALPTASPTRPGGPSPSIEIPPPI
jgi:hypothetical protein